MNKKQMNIYLSDVISFTDPKLTLEQYFTSPQIVSEIIEKVSEYVDLEDKLAADLGAGTGIFSIALSASKCR